MPKTTTKKPKLPTISPDTEALVQRALLSTWDYIAYDCLQMTQEYDGRDTMSRAEVIEVTLDADRPRDTLRRLVGQAAHAKRPIDPAIVAEAEAVLDYSSPLHPHAERLARKAFTFARYGM